MHDEQHFTAPPRRRIGALALIQDTAGERVLMVEKSYNSGPARWGLPGGCAKTNEDAADACRREAQEELGLSLAPGALLTAHRMPGSDSAEGYNFVFDCGQIAADAEIRLGDELTSYRFMTPDEIREHAAPYTAWRVESALRTLSGEAGGYIVGHPEARTAPDAA
ncbi:NUDIX domain-containing protein [Streptomyces sp. Da 82-17]|uniref:NUDIX domain-containing protein n=1 Tax=Streptomyces sp. Da 82-17 TaxID=3377116 RepID=UPI0038D36411